MLFNPRHDIDDKRVDILEDQEDDEEEAQHPNGNEEDDNDNEETIHFDNTTKYPLLRRANLPIKLSP